MIFDLKNIPCDNVRLFGAKASALGRLAQNNINVPEGYVLSNEVYTSYLESNQFRYSPDKYLSHNDEIQDFIINGKFTPGMKGRLIDIHGELTDCGKSTIAIRSSAVCEDNEDHSMAGVFESFVNVKSYDEFEHSIKKCYASFFSDKALAIMLRNNIRFDDIGMGIVIQKFVEGDISGVMFTADTISMDESIVVVNAVKGLCSEFVDGSKKSSSCKVNKCNGQIVDYNASQDTPEINGNVLNMLVDAAKRIEDLFGCCQDVEWTIRDNKLYILQSRPITTFKVNDARVLWAIPDQDADKTWSLSNHDPISPLIEELLLIYNEGITRGMLESGKGEGYFTRIINGYAYYYIAPRDLEKRKKFRDKLDSMNAKGENIFQDAVLPQLMQYRDELSMFVNRQLQIEELLEYIKKSLDFFQQAMYLHVLAVDGSMYLEDFKKYCTDIMPDITDNDFYDLVFRKSELAIERERVLELAECVKSDDTLTKLFDNHLFNEVLYAHLTRYEPGLIVSKADCLPMHSEIKLLQMINDYLRDYGLISLRGHMQITSEVLKEKPWEVLGKIRACMSKDKEIYNESLNKILLNERRILDQIIEKLDENERKDFMIKFRAAEKAFLVNDNHCFLIDLTSQGYLRLALMKAGGALTDREVIKQPEDIYFMKLEEIFSSLTAEVEKLDLDCKVRDRKEKYEKYKKHIPPEYLGKTPDKSSAANKTDVMNDVLKGVSGLGRRITGRIKVINDSTRNHDIKEDCILVLQHGHGCYFLPIINRIKGLIYDEGSPFDHPGILAREFEIPSIYKTGNATKVLKDGDLVELDGIKGEVRIISRVL